MTKYPESFDYLKRWISLCGGGAAVVKVICTAETPRNWIWVATEAAPSNFFKPRCHRRRGIKLPLKILVPNLVTRLVCCLVRWLITAILVIFFTQASPRPFLWHPHVKVRIAAIDDHHYLVEEFSAEAFVFGPEEEKYESRAFGHVEKKHDDDCSTNFIHAWELLHSYTVA
jgi:hypothetical protein